MTRSLTEIAQSAAGGGSKDVPPLRGGPPHMLRVRKTRMGRQLTADQNTLYRRTDEVLHYLWDPCGVAGCPQARDEYYSYLPQVFALLDEGADETAITDYLVGVERESMGLSPKRQRVQEVAAVLIDYRETIREQAF